MEGKKLKAKRKLKDNFNVKHINTTVVLSPM